MSATDTKESASSDKAASETSTPIWATGPEQVKVDLDLGGEYDIDLDIAKRMGLVQGESLYPFLP
jgi:hypothetical protein